MHDFLPVIVERTRRTSFLLAGASTSGGGDIVTGSDVLSASGLSVLGQARTPLGQDDFVASHIGGSIQIRPTPVAALRRPGPRGLRVLMFGGGPLVGWGLRDHNLGLAGEVADQLASGLRRGVELDVVADADPSRQIAVDGLRGLRLWRYDAIIAVLGDASQRVQARDQSYWVAELVRTLVTEASSIAPLHVYDPASVPPPVRSMRSRVVARQAQVQTLAGEEACARTGRVRFAELPAPYRVPLEGRPFATGQFEQWAGQIVDRLKSQLQQSATLAFGSEQAAARPDDERLRQRALDCLHLSPGSTPRLEQIVRKAREMYGVDGAAINIIDGGTQWSKVAVPALPAMPRTSAFCDMAIQADGSTLVNDTWLDPRSASSPLAQGERGVRFYAAHPIRSWDGYRIGTLCVYGPAPRKMRQSELDPLRGLAGLVEQELWAGALRPSVE